MSIFKFNEPITCDINVDLTAFSQVPEGEYVARINELKSVTSAAGRDYNFLVFEITDGDFSGEEISIPITLDGSPSEIRRRNSMLGLLGAACGLSKLNDIEDLMGQDLIIEITADKKPGSNRVYNNLIGAREAVRKPKKTSASKKTVVSKIDYATAVQSGYPIDEDDDYELFLCDETGRVYEKERGTSQMTWYKPMADGDTEPKIGGTEDVTKFEII